MESIIASVYIADATRLYDKEYSYIVPDTMLQLISAGMRVTVPFGSRNTLREGLVCRLFGENDPEAVRIPRVKLKYITRLYSDEPYLDPAMLDFALWMKERYLCTFYDAARCLLPSSSHYGAKFIKAACLAMPAADIIELINSERLDRIQHVRVLEMLLENEFTAVQDIKKYAGVSDSVIDTLRKRNYLDIVRIQVQRDPCATMENNPTEPFEPTTGQAAAINRIMSDTDGRCFSEMLLHGITGSGKTEVYLQAISHVLDMGRQAIVLVPEISLTPQMVDRFRSRFGEQVALLHSKLSPGERYDQWRLIKDGARQVVIGPRSAVFAPVADPGLIIIDEEHDWAYKSEVTPRYHAAEVARERCRRHDGVLLLGSATPSIETYHRAVNGCIGLVTLDERPNNSRLPDVDVADMREELSGGNRSVFSRRLHGEISRNIHDRSQTMLMLNRRGHSSFILCRGCGHVVRCRHCNVSLTAHHPKKGAERLICHYCGYTTMVPSKCPVCGSSSIRQFGAGTQKIEEEVRKSFPAASVIRMDMDTTSAKNAHEEILRRFRNEGIDVMVGTQMISKGHDFPNVTLVGILAADSMLNVPDFRASEKTFQLLTQVSGRAGRGMNPGRVIIQTYNTDDYSINAACSQDFIRFYEQEIKIREQLNYPPFTNLASLVISSEDDESAEKFAENLRGEMCKVVERIEGDASKFEIIGPGRSPISRLNGRYRWRIIVKCGDMEKLTAVMKEISAYISQNAEKSKAAAVIDLNPYDML